MVINIIIPVRDDRRVFQLLSCLRVLLSDPRIRFHYQITVALNGASDKFRILLKNYSQGSRLFTILESERAGIAHARNMGIRHSNADYVLHLDSDCTFAEDYFGALEDLICGNSLEVVRGSVIFVPQHTFFSRLNCYLRDKIYLHQNSTFMPNLLVKKDLYTWFGFLQEETFAAEDTEWGDRILKDGQVKIREVPELVVFHEDDPVPRKTMKMWFLYGVGCAYRSRHKPVATFWSVLKMQLDTLRYFPSHRSLFYLFYILIHSVGFLFYKARTTWRPK